MKTTYTEKHSGNSVIPSGAKGYTVKDEIKNINMFMTLLSEKIDLINNDTKRSISELQHRLQESIHNLSLQIAQEEVKHTKYISENAWKTVGLLLGAQTGMLAIFGFVQSFILQR
jgi:hypothetical protein